VGEDVSRYDALYGKPVDVTVDDLVQESGSYTNRAVRTHGRLELSFERRSGRTCLRGFLYQIRIAPVREVATEWEQEAMKMMGGDVEITGVFVEIGRAQRRAGSLWRAVLELHRAAGEGAEGRDQGPEVSAGEAGGNPGKRDGQMIRVVGKFRGKEPLRRPAREHPAHRRGLGDQGRPLRGLGDGEKPRARGGSSIPDSSATPASGSRSSASRRRCAA
jgi:hypothetical protein